METYEQITLDQWVQWKEDIRKKLAETAGNFVHIGYRLKQIRDSGMFGGAADIFGFAEQEYGLGRSTVSRFMAINTKYSEGGNSLELKEEFRAFSSSKLAEMLTLPDGDLQLITEKTTIREIRGLKEFGRSPAVPGADAGQAPLEKCIIDFFKDKKEALDKAMGLLAEEPPEYRQAAETINPSGQASHKKGIVFLFFYNWNTGVKYKLMGQPDPVCLTWPEFLGETERIYGGGCPDAWENFYGAGEPAVATSQQTGRWEETEDAAAGGTGGSPEGAQTPGAEKEPDRGAGETGRPAGTEEETPAAAETRQDVPPMAAGLPETARKPPEDDAPAAGAGLDSPPEGGLPGQMDVYDYPELIPDGKENQTAPEDNAAGGGKGAGEYGQDTTAPPEQGEPSGSTGAAPEEPGTDAPWEHPEGDGAAEDGGRAGHTGYRASLPPEEDLWGEAWGAESNMKQYFDAWRGKEQSMDTGTLRMMYRESVSLAAALEKIIITRGGEYE